MPDWFLISVFFVFYAMFCFGMFIAILKIMFWTADRVWKLLRKMIPSLPEDREEYYERTIREIKDTHTKLGWISNKDKH